MWMLNSIVILIVIIIMCLGCYCLGILSNGLDIRRNIKHKGSSKLTFLDFTVKEKCRR